MVLIEFCNGEVMWVYGNFKNTGEAQEFKEERVAEIERLRNTDQWVKEPREFQAVGLIPVK